ncbi:class I SAM-dependent methyltransferase [Frankia gtarii]|uniref:class I SAM-dependent methyltransferase n=1 Tax=Frankia gtarii TaxID=2950102 RepID=UPI0021BEEB1A|nr:class I SAM-dependent methyltransferase [Frankia gtarii]
MPAVPVPRAESDDDRDPVAATRASYDRVAGDYAARTAQVSAPLAAWRSGFCDLLPAAALIADLGCGPGRDLAVFSHAGMAAVGLDLSEQMLRLARAAGGRTAAGDIRRPPLKPAAFHGLWSNAALLHVPRREVASTLRAWRSLLRDGGVLGLSTSLGGREGWEAAPYRDDYPPSVALRRWFVHHDRDDLLTLIEQAGFALLAVQQEQRRMSWLQVKAIAT